MSDVLLVLVGGGIGVAGSLGGAALNSRGESKRLDRQLRHERVLSERAELRTLIDDAIQTVQDGIYAAIEMRSALMEVPPLTPLIQEEYDRAKANLRAIERRLNGYQSRLAIRLKVGNPLAEAVKGCREQLGVYRMLAPGISSSKVEEPMLSELQAVIDKASGLAEQFERKAVAYAESELSTEEESKPSERPWRANLRVNLRHLGWPGI